MGTTILLMFCGLYRAGQGQSCRQGWAALHPACHQGPCLRWAACRCGLACPPWAPCCPPAPCLAASRGPWACRLLASDPHQVHFSQAAPSASDSGTKQYVHALLKLCVALMMPDHAASWLPTPTRWAPSPADSDTQWNDHALSQHGHCIAPHHHLSLNFLWFLAASADDLHSYLLPQSREDSGPET